MQNSRKTLEPFACIKVAKYHVKWRHNCVITDKTERYELRPRFYAFEL